MDKFDPKIRVSELEENYPSPHSHEVITPGSQVPLLSPETEHQNVGFARASLAFSDRLKSIRRKRDSQHNLVASETTAIDAEKNAESAIPKSIKILRCIQSTLTALLSLAIAFIQGRVYVIFLRTKNVPGAWPHTPQLLPTLLLFSVAIAAFTFDVCMLLAYLMPGKRWAQKCYKVAVGAHYIVTSAKTVAYALTSVVCRTGFNFGNASGTNMDLWSWTCTAKAAEMASVNSAPSNCDTQTVAWYFALAQIGIELIGIVIGVLVFQQKMANLGKDEEDADAKESTSPANSRYEKLNALSPEVDTKLGEVTPEIDTHFQFNNVNL